MTLLYSKFNQLSDMWQQPVSSTFELESDLQVTVDWGKTGLVDFNAGKIQTVSFDHGGSKEKEGTTLKNSNFKQLVFSIRE